MEDALSSRIGSVKTLSRTGNGKDALSTIPLQARPTRMIKAGPFHRSSLRSFFIVVSSSKCGGNLFHKLSHFSLHANECAYSG